MLGTEKNVVNVHEEDRDFIRALMLISHEKKILLQGILIGMDLQESQEAKEKHSQNEESRQLSIESISK
ncbi:MAG: hypothetical protein K2O40_04895 [Lachnospiraceae bacterium]|nr:hypothetical protein [Lachnospiraceae bacterium]